MTSNDLEWLQMTFYGVLLIIYFKISSISAMFEEIPDFSTSDLHELHDRKLRNQYMMEQNSECQSHFWDIFTQENYFVWVREVFHKSRIPTKFNLYMSHVTWPIGSGQWIPRLSLLKKSSLFLGDEMTKSKMFWKIVLR